MDQQSSTKRSNIARPISRIPGARASVIPHQIHQDEVSKPSALPRSSIATRKIWPSGTKPLGESNGVSMRPLPTSTTSGLRAPNQKFRSSSALAEADPDDESSAISVQSVSSGDENAALSSITSQVVRTEKRRPRPSLSDRTIETLSQVSPAPSPIRRRSSTVRSNGSMGPPARPASAVRNSRPNTPSTPSSGRAPSPVKQQFRPPGKPPSSVARRPVQPTLSTIYTPPRALMRDRAPNSTRTSRDARRSISSTASNKSQEDKTVSKPANKAGKVKSMYDLRAAAAATRGLAAKSSLSNLKPPSTPKQMTRKPSFETSPSTGFLKARSPGENVIATCSRAVKHYPKTTVATLRKPPVPIANQTQKREPSASATATAPSKSSSALRETIAKAKASRRAELRESLGTSQPQDAWGPDNVPEEEPIISMGAQSLKKKIDTAATTGVLNLSAMSLREIPSQVLKMYDFSEGSSISWSETVDLTKLLLADNELDHIADEFLPDWDEQEMINDPDKSNILGGLESLDLHGNALSQLPIGLRRLKHLINLNISNNRFDASVFERMASLTNLRELRVAHNSIGGLVPASLGQLTNLQILDLSNNQLESLPNGLSKLTNLRKLLLNNNKIDVVNLEALSCDGLLELNLSNNSLATPFRDADLARFTNLQVLDLNMNSFQNICDVQLRLPSLHSLLVSNNRLESLPDLSECTALSTLTAAENSLADIPDSFYQLQSMRNADFGNNSIKVISPSIADMISLANFNVAGNPLREKKYLTMTVEDIKLDFRRKNEQTSDLTQALGPTDSTDHGLGSADVAQSTPTVTRPKQGILDMSSKNLSAIDVSQIDLSTIVHTIRLANNELTAFPSELLLHDKVRWTLKSLDLSHNPLLDPIEYLTCDIHLPTLQSLYIVSTGLTTLDTLTTHLKAPELKELNISCHRLAGHVPWVTAYYPNLTTLLASDNWFDSIDIEGVRGLEVLDLRNNEIETLPPKLGLLGNHVNKNESGRLRSFECSGNRFRVPRLAVIEKGTEAILRDLRRMIATADVPEEWALEV